MGDLDKVVEQIEELETKHNSKELFLQHEITLLKQKVNRNQSEFNKTNAMLTRQVENKNNKIKALNNRVNAQINKINEKNKEIEIQKKKIETLLNCIYSLKFNNISINEKIVKDKVLELVDKCATINLEESKSEQTIFKLDASNQSEPEVPAPEVSESAQS